MPTFPYFLRSAEDFCLNCDQPLCEHDREREYHNGGTWSYNYYCPDGSEMLSAMKKQRQRE